MYRVIWLNTAIDAHAHIIENGYMMQLPLTGTSSIQGQQSSPFNDILNVQSKMSLIASNNISRPTQMSTIILLGGLRAWAGIRPSGQNASSLLPQVYFLYCLIFFSILSTVRSRPRSSTQREINFVESYRRARPLGITCSP